MPLDAPENMFGELPITLRGVFYEISLCNLIFYVSLRHLEYTKQGCPA